MKICNSRPCSLVVDCNVTPEKHQHPNKNNETITYKSPIQDAETAYQKALTTLKTTIDKISKDMQDVKIVEVSMSKKRWDTTAQVAWLRAETKKVAVKKERYLERLLMRTFVWAGHALYFYMSVGV